MENTRGTPPGGGSKAPVIEICLGCLWKRGEKVRLVERFVRQEVRVGRRRFRARIAGDVCPACGAFSDARGRLEHRLAVARRLADEGERTPESVRFIREQARLAATDLAKLLGITRQTIHRWETGRTPIDVASFVVLRLLLEDYAAEQRAVRQYLERLRDG